MKLFITNLILLASLLLGSLLTGSEIPLPGYNAQDPYIDTLRVEHFNIQADKQSFWNELSLFNTDFYSSGNVNTIRIHENNPKLIYKTWMQNKPAPLILIIPGFGSSYVEETITAMAELFYQNGYSVAIISNPLNWQFMESASSVTVPGYTPIDARDAYTALEKIVNTIEKKYPGKITEKVLAGYSLGGLHTLFISDLDRKEKKINFDRFLAVNPPVDLFYAMRKLDQIYTCWMKWDDKIEENVKRSAIVFAGMVQNQIPQNAPLPMTSDQAKFVIGYGFYRLLKDMIYSIHKKRDFGFINASSSWFSRGKLYKELDNFTFNRYLNTFVDKYYSEKWQKNILLEDMNTKSSMPSLEKSLSTNPKIRVIHNADDFLLSKEHLKWLKNTLQDRLKIFKNGGHLGNLYRKEVKDTIITTLKEEIKEEIDLPQEEEKEEIKEEIEPVKPPEIKTSKKFRQISGNPIN